MNGVITLTMVDWADCSNQKQNVMEILLDINFSLLSRMVLHSTVAFYFLRGHTEDFACASSA